MILILNTVSAIPRSCLKNFSQIKNNNDCIVNMKLTFFQLIMPLKFQNFIPAINYKNLLLFKPLILLRNFKKKGHSCKE